MAKGRRPIRHHHTDLEARDQTAKKQQREGHGRCQNGDPVRPNSVAIKGSQDSLLYEHRRGTERVAVTRNPAILSGRSGRA